MRRCGSSVEEAGISERERAGTKRHDAGSASVPATECLHKVLAGTTIDPAPARDNDRVGPRYGLEAVVERHGEVTDAQHGSIRAAHRVAVPPDSEILAAVQTEELVGYRRFEGAHPVDEHGYDPVAAGVMARI